MFMLKLENYRSMSLMVITGTSGRVNGVLDIVVPCNICVVNQVV
jgi:hypothetical protein